MFNHAVINIVDKLNAHVGVSAKARVYILVLVHTLFMQTVNAQASLCIFVDTHQTSLLEYD